MRAEEAFDARALRTLRTSLSWTQARLATVIGVHPCTVSRWECCRSIPSAPNQARLRALAAASARHQPQPAQALPCSAHGILSDAARSALAHDIKTRLNGRRVVASISGGKDSAAMSLWLSELGIDHDRVFLDTGWESDLTYEYLREVLQKKLGPITWVRPQRQMEELILHKGMFPSRLRRFCTQELKFFPMARYLHARLEAGEDLVNAVGIRAAESPMRAQMIEWEWVSEFDCEIWRPLLRWSEQDVIAIHKRHGLQPNPLYLLGASRVGCWPCIYARKGEIRVIADTDPQRIVRLRVLEDAVAVGAQQRAEAAGRELPNKPAWFQNRTNTDGACWPIDKVVAWSRTKRGGHEEDKEDHLFAAQMDGCMRWGMCETLSAA